MSQDPNYNPYTAPGVPASSGASDKVNIPSILLMVCGGIGVLHALFMVVMGLLGGQQVAPPPEMQGDQQAMEIFNMIQNLQGPMLIGLGLLALIVSGLVLFGAIKMRSITGYGLAVTSSILAMLPCTYGCCLGLPIGIWSLVVLMNNDVKSAFH
jgi:hypothetical protein